MLKKVGVEPSAGQIIANSPEARIERILEMFARYTGHPMKIDRDVYESEHRTRNFEISSRAIDRCQKTEVG